MATRMRRIGAQPRTAALGALVIASLFIAACGADPPAELSMPSSRSVCDLISAKQATQILGMSTKPIPRTDQTGECRYVNEKGAQLTVARFVSSGAVSYVHDTLSAAAHDPALHLGTVDGEDTVWTPELDGGKLDALKGSNALIIWVAYGVHDPKLAADKAMAIVMPAV
jgi:hypothetical protein